MNSINIPNGAPTPIPAPSTININANGPGIIRDVTTSAIGTLIGGAVILGIAIWAWKKSE